MGDIELLCSAAPLEIGNRVWWDDNLNGVQDPGTTEGPIAGVILELYLIDASDTLTNGQDLATVTSTLVATTTTDTQGRYYFSSVADSAAVKVPAGYAAQSWVSGTEVLEDRTYQIRIPDWDGSTGALAANNTAIAANLGAGETLFLAPGPNTVAGSANVKPSSDSIAANTIQDTDAYDNPGNAAIVVDTGGAGENNHSLDFVFGGDTDADSVVIGNRVWYDANDNGEDSGESGIDGVTVELLQGGAVISTTTTANGGYYLFSRDDNGDVLLDGDYQVRIPASNFGAGQPLQYYQSSSVDGGDPDNNIDLDDNGPGSATGADVTSNLVTVNFGDEPTSDGDDSDGNLTVDFGFYLPPLELSAEKRKVTPTGAALVGDTVSYELRIENTGQMTVTELVFRDTYDASGLQFTSATTTPDVMASGVLTWTGTTTTGNLQGDLPLTPGSVVTITVDFAAIEQ